MPLITIELTGVSRVVEFYNNGLPVPFTFKNNQIEIALSGSVSIHVEGKGTSCSSTVKDSKGEVIRASKEYKYNDEGGAIIRYHNL